MRLHFVSVLGCVLSIFALPLVAQNGAPAASSPSTQVPPQSSTSPQQQDSTSDQEPVLKRRPPQDQTHTVETSNPSQQTPQSATTIPSARTVPASTQFSAELDSTLSSTATHPGDTFTATLSQPLLSQRGDTLIPAGAKLSGTVQEAESGKIFASMRGKGKLSLRFQEIQLLDGTRLPIQATLLGIGKNAKGAKADDEGNITGTANGKNTVKDIGIGAGAGTLAGLIMGHAMKGMAIGAIAGGGYVLANAGKDVELPANTELKVRLDQYLTLPQNVAITTH